MCGIAGYVGLALEDRILQGMSESVSHRGPDDEGIWTAPGVGLAHRRLSIIDLSVAGHQPMISTCGRYVIIFNGEIYNYIEIRQTLEAEGVVFRSQSDTEVLLAAYVHWGRKCLDRLNGMWSFVIWDREEGQLFASRDRFGKKPFYYFRHQEGLVFASEIAALLSTRMVSARANPKMIADFCGDRVLDHTEQTCFLGIHQLPAGHCLEWSQGRFHVHQYWSLADASHSTPPSPDLEEITELLVDAVKLRLRADTPVGVLLSGGLDSSTVTCIASALSGQQVHAFSTIEQELSEEAAGIAHVEHACPNLAVHSDLPTVQTFVADLDACLRFQEEPFADGSMVAHFRLMRLAREKGVKVLLTGQGADEVFAGYPGHLTVHLAALLKNGRSAEYIAFARALRKTGQPVQHWSALGYSLPDAIKSRVRAMRAARSLDWLQPEFREMSSSIIHGYDAGNHAHALNDALLVAIRMRTLPGFLHYEDRNSMAFGVESRLPFLDFRLVAKMQSVEGKRKVRNGVTKSMLRDAVQGIVPKAIIDRKGKQGYPAPLGEWLRSAEPETWGRWLEAIRRCPLIIGPRWHAYRTKFLAGDSGALAQVWRGLILALWFSMFINVE